MDAEEVGMYWLLCCVAWQQTPPCSLPDDDEKLAKWARVSHDTFMQKSVNVKACFRKKRGRLVQEGLLREWQKQKERRAKATDSANKRWDSERNAKAMRTHSKGNALRTSSSTSSSTAKKKSTLSGKPDDISLVLNYLNEKTGRSYRLTDTNRSLINARLQNYSVAEITNVIDAKSTEWRGTDMDKYLRPNTLFNATKFDNYMNETPTEAKPVLQIRDIIKEAEALDG
jgi:uncharacterized phage protein (TIGR02220 family)